MSSQDADKFVVAFNMADRPRLGQNMTSIKEFEEALEDWLRRDPDFQERKKVRELVEKLPSKWSSGHTIVDRMKDMALSWEFERADSLGNNGLHGCIPDHPPFFLDRHFKPKRVVYDIDVVKARAAWRADIEAGIRRPDHYYVSQEFYIEEKKEKIAKHAAAHAAAVASAQADKSFWAFSLL